jgi:hypothetical protein
MRNRLQAWMLGTERGTQVRINLRTFGGTELHLEFHWPRNGNRRRLLHRLGKILRRILRIAGTLLTLWAALRTLGFG